MRWIVDLRDVFTWRCSKCGGKVNNTDYLFCPHCGEKTDEPHGIRETKIKWTPTKEKLPILEKAYLISYLKDAEVCVGMAYYKSGRWLWNSKLWGSKVKYVVTAWAKMPDAYKTWEDIEREEAAHDAGRNDTGNTVIYHDTDPDLRVRDSE